MRERLLFTFLFHLFAISLLFVPNKYQGAVVTSLWSVPLRTMDTAAIFLMLAGSVYLFASLFIILRRQMREESENPPDNTTDKKQ